MKITKKEAIKFKNRWEVINAFEHDELRRTSMDIKMQQLAALMASVNELGWEKALSEGEDKLRERWNRLRRAYNVL
ncbi:MAG: hypothetical protein HZA08_13575 [Nitrospirae bacterium]|nr:hypothetical protein [Nitrospirota bacterium]